MKFNSITFFIFLPLVFLLFLIIADRYKWLLLLIASYIFYGFLFEPILLIVLTLVTLITFVVGKYIERQQEIRSRYRWLLVGVMSNIFFLIYFKYLPFLTQSLNVILSVLKLDLSLQVPSPFVSVALSFFIFQAISYHADIYFRLAKPEQHFGYFALYMSFFPKLLQGPIERAGKLLPQLKAPYEFDYDKVRSGMLLIAWGLFKKIVLADRLALYVNPVYNNLHAYSGLPLLIATYAYALQIYFDFAGYTDIARGTARVFGVELTPNFQSPYMATSCADFWRRWHISFSRWIYDYIFDPLQMKFRHAGKVGTVLALFVTFLVCGVWHGANWCFVIFGLLHGLYLTSAIFYRPYQKRLHNWLGLRKGVVLTTWQIFVTFNLVSFSIIFFRSQNLEDAFYVVKHIFNFYSNYELMHKNGITSFISKNVLMDTSVYNSVVILCLFALMCCVYKNSAVQIATKQSWFRWTCYYGILLSLILLGVDTRSDFIYFKF